MVNEAENFRKRKEGLNAILRTRSLLLPESSYMILRNDMNQNVHGWPLCILHFLDVNSETAEV